MGRPMAGRLAAAGYQVLGYDVAGTVERLPEGAQAAASMAELAARTDILFLSVPDGTASRAICAEIAELSERRTQTVVDLSTIGISAARECAA